MKKLLSALFVGSMALSMAACGQTKEEPKEEPKETVEATGTYTVFNTTGETVTDLYVYEADSTEKGENLAGEGLKDGEKIKVTYGADSEEAVLVLEFTTESGETKKFETLHIEEAPISLLAEDAMSGATPISFFAPEATGVYTFYNGTEQDITDLYVYEVGSEDKGTNYAEGFKDGTVVEITAGADAVLVVEFTTKDGKTAKFETLHIEEAPITLLSEDTMTGATPIAFEAK